MAGLTSAGPGPASSAWAPLRTRIFRTLWLASLASYVGTWMQTVGAHWLVVHKAHAAILVSLVHPPPRIDHYLAAAPE